MINKILVTLSLMLSWAILSNCGGNNAYDGENLLGSSTVATQSQADALTSLQQNVFLAHANGLVQELKELNSTMQRLEANTTSSTVTKLQNHFVAIMKEWKAVEAGYIALDYSDELIDTPQFIDYYHTGNIDVASDIDTALGKSGKVSDYMYRNSSKTITALEYLLYGDNATTASLATSLNKRKKEAIGIVVENLIFRANKIAVFYASDTNFSTNATDAANSMVNVLVDSAYKLKEWRIGEASGIAVKYKESPDPSRLEYAKSRLSLEAMKTILLTHQEIMGEQTYGNFGSFAVENGASTIVASIRNEIKTALALVNSFNAPIEDSITTKSYDSKVADLYTSIKSLQALYYESLIASLNLTAEIIEADGD
jgi:predicted lipoprotein